MGKLLVVERNTLNQIPLSIFCFFIGILMLYCHHHDQLYKHICMWNHTDAIKTSDTVLLKIYLSLYLKGLCVRGSWRPNRTETYWPPTLIAISVSFPFSCAAQPEVRGPSSLRGAVFSTASFLQLIWSPKLSLNFLCTELYNSSTSTQYFMHFRRLWNGMFDRHRAEITDMQLTGHSLPVHQFVTVPWDFNPVPYCQPSLPTPMEYALPPSLEWHVWPGWRSIYYTKNHIFEWKLFVFEILKPNNRVQANDYYQTEIVSWKSIVVYE